MVDVFRKLSDVPLPSLGSYEQQVSLLPLSDLAFSVTPNRMHGTHLYLVLESKNMLFHPYSSLLSLDPKHWNQHTGLRSDDISDTGKSDLLVNTAGSTNAVHFVEKNVSLSSNQDSNSYIFHISIIVFCSLDAVMFVTRMSWMVRQIKAARRGCVDHIPTDSMSQKILSIHIGYDPAPFQAIKQSNRQKLKSRKAISTLNPSASETGFSVHFCQSYPKSRHDIIHELALTQKVNTSSDPDMVLNVNQRFRNVTNGDLNDSCRGMSLIGLPRLVWKWLHCVMAPCLAWRFAVTVAAIALMCLAMHFIDVWLVPSNPFLFSVHGVLYDLQLQVSFCFSHLSVVCFRFVRLHV